MASSYYAQRDAYNRSPSPLLHHRPPPPAGSASASQPLRFLPPSQAHRQNTAPPAPYGYLGHAAAPYHPDYHPQHAPPPSPHTASASDSEPSCIKCSSCAAWVRLEDLGGHVCAGARARDERRAPPVGLQLERGGGGGPGLNGGRSPGQYLHASPPGSAPLPFPAPSSSASPSGSSNARLGFFDRYQQLVDTSELAAGNMAGVGSARSPRLAPGGGGGFPHHQHPLHPPQRSTTAPLPTSVSAPNLSVPGHAPYYPQTQQRRRPEPDSDRAPPSPSPSSSPDVGLYRQPSPTPISSRSMASEWSAAQRERAYAHNGLDTPASSVAPSSSSRSRKESLPRSAAAAPVQQHEQLARAASQSSSSASSAYLAYDRFSSDSLPQSRSTPAGLGAWGPASGVGTSGGGGGGGGAGGLDACLEDLRLMADGEDGSAVGEETLEALFEGRRRDGESGKDELRDDYDDLLATPRQAPRRRDKDPPSSAPKSPSLAPSSPLSPPPPTSTSTTPLSCTACRTPLPPSATPKRTSAGPPFCRPCYADRFLPKCRRCALPIEGGAVTSSDGKIQGKYHPACFSCWACAVKFPSGEFYCFDGKPYCQQDYHALNGSLCADSRCGKPIEGPCVSLIGEDKGGGGRYHPPCFNCSDPSCLVPLLSHHFVVDRLPYCDVHAAGPVRRRAPRQGAPEGVEARAKKRQTIITRS
ncbi:hypothetical protein JCM8208_005557 [Rhodotorula glutinis]